MKIIKLKNIKDFRVGDYPHLLYFKVFYFNSKISVKLNDINVNRDIIIEHI